MAERKLAKQSHEQHHAGKVTHIKARKEADWRVGHLVDGKQRVDRGQPDVLEGARRDVALVERRHLHAHLRISQVGKPIMMAL